MNARPAACSGALFSGVLCALAWAAPLRAQTGKIEGIVRKDGQPADQVQVLLVSDHSDGTLGAVTTKGDGRYLFDNIKTKFTVTLTLTLGSLKPVSITGLPPRTAHVISPEFETYAAQPKDVTGFNATVRDTSVALSVYRRVRPFSDVPAWAVTGTNWLTDTMAELGGQPPERQPNDVAPRFRELNAFTSLYKTMRHSATHSINLGREGSYTRIIRPGEGLGMDPIPWVLYSDTKNVEVMPIRNNVFGKKTLPKLDWTAFDADAPPIGGFDFKALMIFNKSGAAVECNVFEPGWKKKGKLLTPFTTPIAISPDGKLVATSAEDGAVIVIASNKGFPIALLRPGRDAVLASCFSADGRLFATGSVLGDVAFWEMPTGKLLRRLKLNVPLVTALAFTPQAKRLAIGTGPAGRGKLILCDRSGEDWKVVSELAVDRSNSDIVELEASPDGRKLLVFLGGKAPALEFDISERQPRLLRAFEPAVHPLFLEQSVVGVIRPIGGGAQKQPEGIQFNVLK